MPEGVCGKPAVDFIDEGDGDRFYLCAEHWDEFGDGPEDDDFEDF
jgi:hypothetical protein